MTDRFVKTYAVVKSRWLSSNVLDDYLPFVATIILENGMEVIDENIICEKLNAKYDADFQPTFIRQVISNAMAKKAVQKVREHYIANVEVLKQYSISDESFADDWAELVSSFETYAHENEATFDKEAIENNIISFLEKYDDHVIYNNIGDIDIGNNAFLFHWCNYVLQIQTQNTHIYEFICALCSANLMKETLFYSRMDTPTKMELSVYFDTPMIFAVLGMDTPERKRAYKYIVENAITAGMTLHVFEHSLSEALGIMERAAKWSQRADYDSAKANRVAQFFHNSTMEPEDMVEYIGEVESKLNLLGITRQSSSYQEDEHLFQADEQVLFDAIKNEYGRRALKYRTESDFDSSIRTDVRSIVMIQRKRKGTVSTMLKNAQCIFISTNGVIAKVSKDAMQADKLTRGMIPACITADIFGTILWMDFPGNGSYHSLKLLADCKALLRPTPQMIATFNLKLDEAYQKKAEGLTEEKFLFLRSHSIVQAKLLDATTGDYSLFTDQTWREVYKRIESHAMYEGEKKFNEEKREHDETKKQLTKTKAAFESEVVKGISLSKTVENQRDRFSEILAQIISAIVFGVPYLAIAVAIIIIQNAFVTLTVKGICIAVLTIAGGTLAAFFYKKLVNGIKVKIKKYL